MRRSFLLRILRGGWRRRRGIRRNDIIWGFGAGGSGLGEKSEKRQPNIPTLSKPLNQPQRPPVKILDCDNSYIVVYQLNKFIIKTKNNINVGIMINIQETVIPIAIIADQDIKFIKVIPVLIMIEVGIFCFKIVQVGKKNDNQIMINPIDMRSGLKFNS